MKILEKLKASGCLQVVVAGAHGQASQQIQSLLAQSGRQVYHRDSPPNVSRQRGRGEGKKKKCNLQQKL